MASSAGGAFRQLFPPFAVTAHPKAKSGHGVLKKSTPTGLGHTFLGASAERQSPKEIRVSARHVWNGAPKPAFWLGAEQGDIAV